ncbi:hypothetical protein HS088_TW21G01208 [Tripterygium wilfordii]|uniref:Homer protein n=1 Tax=Tripterygium wilfordii TaxID=458696 RepID=A0A7J7C4K1_TRIWF|nr:uncharacterized protein LOC119988876 [Tripterygium wilfordii]KAF5729051.1 hypothetical protein HS088_TW21G01208 [Tripterygium wilfordii]
MVELQSCASLINSSALCVIEQEMKGESVDVVAEISAELQRERQRNAELLERISILEAKMLGRDKPIRRDEQGSCANATETSIKKVKRQRIDRSEDMAEDKNISINNTALQMKHETRYMLHGEAKLEDCIVNWMSMDNHETQLLHIDRLKDDDCAADCDDTDDGVESEEAATNIDHKYGAIDGNTEYANEVKVCCHEEAGANDGINGPCMRISFGGQDVPTLPHVDVVTNEERYCRLSNREPVYNQRDFRDQDREETRVFGHSQMPVANSKSNKEACKSGFGSMPLLKKPPKVAFCPKEVKRILESEALLSKNAQSHSIRKIIVFASLGIRHGSEDMYDLDFNHFSIIGKGEPYLSPKNPGEHVLYENPGVRRKIFYPNRLNPTLCPLQILEEEKAMRPSDPSCPSCLFLCIKYGGRTRNLPQNEYVRQRMGRNKLKSFGPVICRMAILVHIRTGSFFFKALGITLLFMAGFPDDLVQRETKHQNLDLLQKYYRTDEDAKGEELFLPHPETCDTSTANSQLLTGKMILTKLKGKKQTNHVNKPANSQKSSALQYEPSNTAPPAQFGLMGYNPIHAQPVASFLPMPSLSPAEISAIPKPVITGSVSTVPHSNQTPYHMFPPQPPSVFMPMIYWPPPSAFPPSSYLSTYGYQSFPSIGSYMSTHPQPYYNPSCSPFIPKMVEDHKKTDIAPEEASTDSASSSSSTEPQEALPSCK